MPFEIIWGPLLVSDLPIFADALSALRIQRQSDFIEALQLGEYPRTKDHQNQIRTTLDKMRKEFNLILYGNQNGQEKFISWDDVKSSFDINKMLGSAGNVG